VTAARSSSTLGRRIVFLLPGALALVAGMWGGLLRVPLMVPWPVDHGYWLSHHGALMVSGFLGTLIGVERAVGSGTRWGWGAPVLTGAGAVACVAGHPSHALALFLAGSMWFTAVNVAIAWRHRHLFTALMACGAAAWVAGNALAWTGADVPRVVWWWAAFLSWTIVAERLELTRLMKLSASARPLLLAVLAVQLVGTIGITVATPWGGPVVGVALVLQALWLLRHDIARRNVRLGGLPAFTAICLLTGYVWLAFTGVTLAVGSPLAPGSTYDAALHAFFLGFAFAMIFGHAPIILPAVLGTPIAFTRLFFVHVVLLQISLLVRIAADLTGEGVVRRWGAGGNVVAIAVFLAVTAGRALFSRRHAEHAPSPSP
jgi:hypothetical protein